LTKRLKEPIFENYTDRLILSNHTLSQLNIIDDARHSGKFRSVSSLLNNCVTTMGKRQFLYNLHYPITNGSVLKTSYDVTDHLIDKGEGNHQIIRNKLSPISDLEKFMRKIVTQKISPKNLSSLVDDLNNIEQLNMYTQEDKSLSSYLSSLVLIGTTDYFNINLYCRKIINEALYIFNIEECKQLSDINSNDSISIINKGISPLIDEMSKKSMDGREKLEAICVYFSNLIQKYEKAPMKKTSTTTNIASPSYIKIHETARNNTSLIGTSRRVGLLKNAIGKNDKSTESNVIISYYSKFSDTKEEFTLNLSEVEYTTGSGSKSDMVVTSKEIRKIINDTEDSRIKLLRETQLLFTKYVT
jgi:DNA mismatch repair protein MutS